MTDPDPDFGAGFVAAPEVTSRFARDAMVTPADDAAAMQDRLAEKQREVEQRAEETSDGAFFDDVGAFLGDDGGAADGGDLATQFGHGAVEAGPGDPLLVEAGQSIDRYSTDDDGLSVEVQTYHADAERSAQMEQDVSNRIGDWMDGMHGGTGGGSLGGGGGADPGGDDGAGSFADGVVSVTDDDLDLFQA